MTDQPRLVPQTPSSQLPAASPLCQGKCKGTDRPVWESPAYFAHVAGTDQKVLVCKCCEHTLSPVVPTEDNPARGLAIAPNINAAMSREGEKRFECVNCGFDVVTLPKLVPAE